MKSIQCAICGKKEKIKELYKETFSIKNINSKTFSARRTPDKQHHRFVRCNRCSLIFSNPILPTSKLAKLYSDSSFDYGKESTYLKKTYGYYLKQLLKKKNKKKSLRLLDIGCGNGFFLEEAKEIGVANVYGVEPGKSSVRKAQKWLKKNITVGLYNEKLYKKNFFDIICCFQTLDHIVDPSTFLNTVYAHLKKNGKVLFIVHDTEGLSVKVLGEKSPIFDIEHIFLFNKKSLSSLFRKNKFVNIKTFPVKNTYPLSYWVRMVPLPTVIKNPVVSILEKVSLLNFPLSLRAGNIGIIAQK